MEHIARAVLLTLGLCSGLPGIVDAQTADDTVQWSAAVESAAAVRPGGTATVKLSGAIRDGWHVYALKQEPGGPTPLRVTLETSEIVPDGAQSGSEPEKVHDPRFNLQTQFYTHEFTLRLPVRVAPQLTAGQHLIAVSVRFQSCSDRECLPPRTVHLSVPVAVVAQN